jgi:hypothetical protein
MAATITEPGLLSGTAAKERSEGASGGLLRQIGDFGILVLKDFTSMLSMNRDARGGVLAALREIYDGQYARYLGVDGGTALTWTGKLAVFAACTEAIDSHHAAIAAMGERFVFLRFPQVDEIEQASRAIDHADDHLAVRAALADAVNAVIDHRVEPPPLEDADKNRVIALARLAARCRSPVERDPYRRDITLIPTPEAPARLAQVLSLLFRGMLAVGVPHEEAFRVLIKVALDSMPMMRRSAFDYLAALPAGRWSTTGVIAAPMKYAEQTVRRALEDLAAHGVVEAEGGGQGRTARWRLSAWARALWAAATGDTFPEISET